MNKTEIKAELKRLRKEKEKYKFPQKEFLKINSRIGNLSKMLKPNYKEMQSKAGKIGGKVKPV